MSLLNGPKKSKNANAPVSISAPRPVVVAESEDSINIELAVDSTEVLDDVEVELDSSSAYADLPVVDTTPVNATPAPQSSTLTPPSLNPLDELQRRHSDQVEQSLRNIADAARDQFSRDLLFDVFENRVTLNLEPGTLAVLREQWTAANIPHQRFSQFLAARLTACLRHTSVRPIYVDDAIRLELEERFRTTIFTAQDLLNRIDRTIKPIIQQTPDQQLVLEPMDPELIELITDWFPDEPMPVALARFMREAALKEVGIM